MISYPSENEWKRVFLFTFIYVGLQVYVYVQHVFACPHSVTYTVANDENLLVYVWSTGSRTPSHLTFSSTFALALAGHWPNLQGANEEPRASVYQPNNLNIFKSFQSDRNKQVSRAWKQGHLSASLPPLHQLCRRANFVGDTDWGQVTFKALKKLKGLGLGQQEHGGLHSLTWWGFWSELPPHGSLSDCVFFSSVCLKSAGRKVTPSWSQQVCRSNGGWPAAIANVQTFVSFFVYTQKKNNNNKGECKAIDLVPGHLKKFWWCTPRIPGISRVFQSYMVWDLGTPRSQEEQIRFTPSPGTRNKERKNRVRNMFWTQLEITTAKKEFHCSPVRAP